MNNYIWRGINRSSNGNYHISLGWQYENWSGSFWATYDTADDNFVTDLQSNWLEVDSTFSYTWERENGSSVQLAFCTLHDTSRIAKKCMPDTRTFSWNPSLTFTMTSISILAHYTAEIEKNKVDRDWIYGLVLNLAIFLRLVIL